MLMPETESTIIALGLIFIIVIFIMPKGVMVSIINWIANRPKQINMKPKDLFQRFYKMRLRIARVQSDKDIKGIICSGDKETKSKRFRGIKGSIPDVRCIEFFVKFHWWQLTPSWVLVPTILIKNLLSPIPVIKARGLRNQGAYYIPILRIQDIAQEETLKRFIHDYVINLLDHEQLEILAQEEINNVFEAIAPEPAPQFVVSSYDIPVQGADDVEAGD